MDFGGEIVHPNLTLSYRFVYLLKIEKISTKRKNFSAGEYSSAIFLWFEGKLKLLIVTLLELKSNISLSDKL